MVSAVSMHASQVGPSLTFGQAFVLPALAACFLGSRRSDREASTFGEPLSPYTCWRPELRDFSWSLESAGDTFNGLALLLAVGFAVWQQRRNLEARRKGAGSQAGAEPVHELSDPEVEHLS